MKTNNGVESCDGFDNDCNGSVDDGDNLCPFGEVCDDGNCVPNCGSGEFQCPADKVCDARASISKQVDSLSQLTPSTITVDAVQQSLQTIADDLRAIGKAQGDLSQERRDQVQSANQAFGAEIREVVGTVGRSLSASDAKEQLSNAVKELGTTYKQTYARVDC